MNANDISDTSWPSQLTLTEQTQLISQRELAQKASQDLSILSPKQRDQILLDLIEGGEFTKAARCLEQGADVNCRNESNQTPLLISLQNFGEFGFEKYYDRKDFIDKLISTYNADVHVVENSGLNALHFAAFNGLDDVCKKLISKGIDVNTQAKEVNNHTPLTLATQNMHTAGHGSEETMCEIYKKLIESGANINHQTSEGKTALMELCYFGNENLSYLLITSGADLNVQEGEEFRRTALFFVVENLPQQQFLCNHSYDEWIEYLQCKQRICQMLIMNGADIEAQDANGQTSYQYIQEYPNLKNVLP